MAELVRDRGLVLHTQDHAETDRIVSLLTEGHGQVEILVKGARRLEKTWGAALDILNLAEVIYYRRRSGLHLLREASILRRFSQIPQDLARLEAALDLARWAWELVPREAPDPRPFRLTLSFLLALDVGGPAEIFLRAYKLRLLAILGHRPALRGCLLCGKKEELVWSPDRGGLLCRSCGGEGEAVPTRVWRAMDALLRLPLTALARLRLPAEDLPQIDAMISAFRVAQLAR